MHKFYRLLGRAIYTGRTQVGKNLGAIALFVQLDKKIDPEGGKFLLSPKVQLQGRRTFKILM